MQGKDDIALDWAYLATNEEGEWRPWWNSNWEYRIPIIIDHSFVEADFTNFPILITHISSDFMSHAQTNGDDFVFIDATHTTQYAHEIEYYNSATGELIAWVNISFLSSSENTVLYVYYGNPTCSNQENIPGVWDSDFILVQHMAGSSWDDLDDSSDSGWDITSAGGNPTYNQAGLAGRCVDFDGNGDYFKTGDFRLLEDSSHTGSAWVYVDGNAETRRYVFEGDSDSGISLLVWTNESFKNIARTADEWPVCYSDTIVDVGSPEWFYICTRANAVTDELELFVNGVEA